MTLDERSHLTPVTVAVWDGGVDAALFPGRMWTSPEERPDPDRHDRAGLPGLHGIAFAPGGERTPELIWPLTEEETQQSETLSALVKGSFDVFAGADSPEAQLFRNAMEQTAPGKIEHLLGEIEHFRRASHGTGCAALAAAGNPFIRILSARTSNDSEWTHQPPTVSWAQADGTIFRELVRYLRDQNVRVVNINWGSTSQEFERAMERYGNERDTVRLKGKARQAFDIEKQGLYEAIAQTPSMLFVAASANSDEDDESAERIPQSFKLPNLITVGAVDQSGYAGPFTMLSSVESIYASGFERAAMLGGREYEFMGTSAAAPAVVNLAAKLLAIEPKLTPAQLIKLIKRGGSRNGEGLLILNPKVSLQILSTEGLDRIQ